MCVSGVLLLETDTPPILKGAGPASPNFCVTSLLTFVRFDLERPILLWQQVWVSRHASIRRERRPPLTPRRSDLQRP